MSVREAIAGLSIAGFVWSLVLTLLALTLVVFFNWQGGCVVSAGLATAVFGFAALVLDADWSF